MKEKTGFIDTFGGLIRQATGDLIRIGAEDCTGYGSGIHNSMGEG